MLQKNKIHIFGASGSGTTSIARQLAQRLDYLHFDTDDFYWSDTSPPYTIKYEPLERQQRLSIALTSQKQWILSGSLCDWGDMFIPLFELVIYVYTENQTRLARLRHREEIRFGESIFPGGEQYERYQTFMKWAAAYETTPDISRSAARHRRWLKKITCPVVVIINEKTVTEAVNDIISHMTCCRYTR